jgi:predicted acyl esterase
VLVFGSVLAPGAASATIVDHGRASTPWPGGRWQPDPQSFKMTVVSGVPITMDDGVVLFANVGYPASMATGARAPGRFPVLLTQNPYVGPSEQPDSFYVSRGYIFVSVDVRGTVQSVAPGNAPLPNQLFSPRDAQDGVELVNWAAHQLDGSNGVVGLVGCSFLGIDQLFTAAALGPRSPVKATVPACSSHGYDSYFAGGIPGPSIGLFGVVAGIFGQQHIKENTASGLALQAEVRAGGPRAYDNDYWQVRTTSPDLAAQIVRNNIPALLWTGWNALDGTGVLEFYAALQNAYAHRPPSGPMSTRQPVTGRYQVIDGPWTHGQGLDESIQLEWFDTWLKGQHTRIADTDTPMHLFEMGSARWVNAATYPVVDRYTPLFLGPAGTLSDRPPSPHNGRRSSDPPPSGADTVTWALPAQPDSTLSYTTAPFAQGATLAGPISATIYAASSNTNLELIATLSDIAPDGSATEMTHGDLLGSLGAVDPQKTWLDRDGLVTLPAHPYAADVLLTPGAVNRYDIKVFPTVWSLQPGHSLRLTLSTQSDPSTCRSQLSLLVPNRPCILTAPQTRTLPGGVYTIQRTPLYPSAIDLPLLPDLFLPTARSATTPTSNNLTEPLGWQSDHGGGDQP